MELEVNGKDLKPTESIKEYIEKRLAKLKKYFNDVIKVSVQLKEEGKNKIVQVSVNTGKKNFRAITENEDLYAGIDKVVDVLERQIVKEKDLNEKSMKKIPEMIEENDDEHLDIENEIIKYQTYEVRPMDKENAKILLASQKKQLFLTFIDIETNKVNVIFKLKDGKNFRISCSRNLIINYRWGKIWLKWLI